MEFDESVRIERARARSAARGAAIPAALFGAGGLPLFIMFAHDFNGLPMGWPMRLAITVLPALAIGFIGRLVTRRDAWLWPTAFALPALAISASCLAIPDGGSGAVIWMWIGPANFIAGFVGLLAGRWFTLARAGSSRSVR